MDFYPVGHIKYIAKTTISKMSNVSNQLMKYFKSKNLSGLLAESFSN